MAAVRATAVGAKSVPKVFEKFHAKWLEGIEEVVKLTSRDLDYNVRRKGLDVIGALIDRNFDIFIDILKSEEIFTGVSYDEFKPVLNYERTEVRALGDLFEYLSYDDDWEVKVKLVRLLVKCLEQIRVYK